MRGFCKRSGSCSRNRLARVFPALGLSAVLSLVLLGCFWRECLPKAASQPGQTFALGVVPAIAALHNIFFLVRIALSRRKAVSGAPAWPATPVFARAGERMAYLLTSVLIGEFYGIWAFMLLAPGGDGELALWQQGPAGRGAAWLFGAETFVALLVMFQAMRVVKLENRALCDTEGHVWRCIRCREKHAGAPAPGQTSETVPNTCEAATAEQTLLEKV